MISQEKSGRQTENVFSCPRRAVVDKSETKLTPPAKLFLNQNHVSRREIALIILAGSRAKPQHENSETSPLTNRSQGFLPPEESGAPEAKSDPTVARAPLSGPGQSSCPVPLELNYLRNSIRQNVSFYTI